MSGGRSARKKEFHSNIIVCSELAKQSKAKPVFSTINVSPYYFEV